MSLLDALTRHGTCGAVSPPMQAGVRRFRRVRCCLPAGHPSAPAAVALHVSAEGIRFRAGPPRGRR